MWDRFVSFCEFFSFGVLGFLEFFEFFEFFSFWSGRLEVFFVVLGRFDEGPVFYERLYGYGSCSRLELYLSMISGRMEYP